MKEPCEIRVTCINGRWHVRLFVDDKIYSEDVCECRQDIGLSARLQLRWFDKMGGVSPFAQAARRRLNGGSWRAQGTIVSVNVHAKEQQE